MEKITLEDIDLIVKRINSTYLLGNPHQVKIDLHKTKEGFPIIEFEVVLTRKGGFILSLKKNMSESETYIFLLGFEKGLHVLQIQR